MSYYVRGNDCEVLVAWMSEGNGTYPAVIRRKSDDTTFKIHELVGCALNDTEFIIEKFDVESTDETYIIGGKNLLPLRNAKKVCIETK